jgi:hypothetical protein
VGGVASWPIPSIVGGNGAIRMTNRTHASGYNLSGIVVKFVQLDSFGSGAIHADRDSKNGLELGVLHPSNRDFRLTQVV